MSQRNKSKRIINVNVLPGEPLDGTGRICIHLFVCNPNGLFTEPHVMHQVIKDGIPQKGQIEIKPTRGGLACDPKRNLAPVTKNGITFLTIRTTESRAVTCPKCKASEEYKRDITQSGE